MNIWFRSKYLRDVLSNNLNRLYIPKCHLWLAEKVALKMDPKRNALI